MTEEESTVDPDVDEEAEDPFLGGAALMWRGRFVLSALLLALGSTIMGRSWLRGPPAKVPPLA